MGIKSAFWKPHLDGWRDSGLSQAAYCRQHALSVKCFAYWRRTLGPTLALSSASMPAVVPIVVETSEPQGQVALFDVRSGSFFAPSGLAPMGGGDTYLRRVGTPWNSAHKEFLMNNDAVKRNREPWNSGKLVGQKAPLRLRDIWAIRIRLQLKSNVRDLALFNLAIDSKLRACDLVKLKVRDVAHGNRVATRAIVMQQKTKQPVQFEITEQTRDTTTAWIEAARLSSDSFLFPSRLHGSPHLSTRQYARIVDHWVTEIGLDASAYGTHTMRRTKAALIYRRTKNLRAVQLLLGHTKLESTVRYLGIEVDDALEMAEQTEV